MKAKIIFLLIILMPLMASAQPRFVEGLDDIPLIQDLSLAEEPVLFDSPKGIIAELILKGSSPASRYLIVYEASLNALGWRCGPASETRLTCDKSGETLVISAIIPVRDDIRLRLKLTPN